mmetsp:Transcript_22741/g.38981  ORF Transcript_22741/g.38981 Transcript_22741/m.38981 type:complete len:226 (-) Transcript_22741:35-712(-)
MLDVAADHVPLRHGNDMGDPLPRVNDGASQHASRLSVRREPRRREGQHGLDADVKAGHVEGLEHDLGRVLAVLRRVQGSLRQNNGMIFRFAAQVVKKASLPVLFHEVPVLDLPVSDGVVEDRSLRVCSCMFQCLISNKEVKIEKFVSGQWHFRVCNRDHRRNHKIRLGIAGIAHFCVPGAIINDNRRPDDTAHFLYRYRRAGVPLTYVLLTAICFRGARLRKKVV